MVTLDEFTRYVYGGFSSDVHCRGRCTPKVMPNAFSVSHGQSVGRKNALFLFYSILIFNFYSSGPHPLEKKVENLVQFRNYA